MGDQGPVHGPVPFHWEKMTVYYMDVTEMPAHKHAHRGSYSLGKTRNPIHTLFFIMERVQPLWVESLYDGDVAYGGGGDRVEGVTACG